MKMNKLMMIIMAAQTVLSANEWRIVPIVDKFNEPVPGQANISTIVEGTFSNSATTDSLCAANLTYAFYTSTDLIIQLLDYQKIKKSHFSHTRYKVTIRYPGGETENFTASGEKNSDQIHVKGVKGLQNGTNKILIQGIGNMDEYLLTVKWNAEGESEKIIKDIFKSMEPLTEAQMFELANKGEHKGATVLFKGTVGSLQASSTGSIIIVLKGGLKVPVQIPSKINYKRTTDIKHATGGASKATQINDYAEIYTESTGFNKRGHEIKPPPTLSGNVKEGEMSKFSSRDILIIFKAANVLQANTEVTIRATFNKDGGYESIKFVTINEPLAALIFQ